MKASTQFPSLRAPGVNRELALLVLLTVAANLPFVAQPFHMDDNFYLDMARNAAENPLFPNDLPYVFEGRRLQDMGSHSHPPLVTYCLAAVQALFGEGGGREWIYHLWFLTFPLIAVVSFYFLAARFVERPLWPCLLLAAAPVFQVMSHNLMADVPTLAFWLAATASFIWAVDRKHGGLFAVSAVFQFAAIFTSYQAASLGLLLGFYQVRKNGPIAGWAALASPLMALAGWLAMNYAHYGRFILWDTLGYVQSRQSASLASLGTKLAAILQYQGWLVIFPLFLLYALAAGYRGRLLALVTVGAAYLCQWVVPDYRLADKVAFVVGATAGVFAIGFVARVLRCTFRRIEECFGFDRLAAQWLGLWYFGVAGYCLLLFTEGSARYVLPMIPPFLLLFFRQLEQQEAGEYRLSRKPLLSAAMVASGSLVLTAAWGLLLAQSDRELARVYPRAALDVARAANGLPRYFHGEWGFRYYQRRAGARQLPMDETEVLGGSLVVSPKLALPYRLPAGLESMTEEFRTIEYDLNTPLRTLDSFSPAGFYSTGWGLLPFSISSHPAETVEVRQVSYLVERLPWAHSDGPAGSRPWPSYVEVDGSRRLALLFRPGTRIVYPWELRTAVRLSAVCGVLAGSGDAPPESRYGFELLQRDADGGEVLRQRVDLMGDGGSGGSWMPLEASLQPALQEGCTLEFVFTGPDNVGTVGAIARALLVPDR